MKNTIASGQSNNHCFNQVNSRVRQRSIKRDSGPAAQQEQNRMPCHRFCKRRQTSANAASIAIIVITEQPGE